LAQDFTLPATRALIARALATPAVQSLARRLEKGGVLTCGGVALPAQPFLATVLAFLFPRRPLVLVTDAVKTQERFHQDVATWMQAGGCIAECRGTLPNQPAWIASPLFYPPWELPPQGEQLPHLDTISDRLETLMVLADALSCGAPSRGQTVAFPPPAAGQPGSPAESPTGFGLPVVVVTSVAALLQRTFSPHELRARTVRLARGDRVDPCALVERLQAQGYQPEARVTEKGQMALRGGILDVYPLTTPWPVRLEFFGDELESLRFFDPLTQVSRQEVGQVTLSPAGELGFLKHALQQSQNPGQQPATLLDYLPRETIFLLCEQELLDERAADYAAQVPPGDRLFVSWPEFLARLDYAGMTRVELSEPEPPGFLAAGGDRAGGGEVGSPCFQTLEAFRPLAARPPEPVVAEAQRRQFFQQLHRWLRQGYAVHVFCNNQGEQQRFGELWEEIIACRQPGPDGRELPAADPRAPDAAVPVTHLGALAQGFLWEEARMVVVTDAEIFGRYKVQPPRRLRSAHAPTTRSALDIDFTELEVGDLVVHVQHGIGRYLGLEMLPALSGARAGDQGPDAAATECLVIEYAPRQPGQPPPKLYVPVTEAHLVGKYVGAGRARPPLNTLGGTRWATAKARAQRAVRDIAAELLAVQAARAAQPGHAFPPDTPWQREFEAAFLYEETPDQAQAIRETKADMERPRPMDRLICGDVGFGKTEVALRAAFKAVLGGKQVAVLVPTTVLAQQHFNTFRERMADYPVRVELLSRFRTRREQQRVVRDLAAGAVDVVIGTHRLLQDDIVFKDLGLLVVDEEQRFGVLHKERLKQLRTQVDVLTLSATPIPRTLYLALTGARDLSAIQTPPQDRLPVQTIVAPYDERLIRDAIQRELNRGGQVYFLHNRVLTIETMAATLKRLVPRARIVVGHGQLPSETLEEVMTRFVNGQADVLLSTTIIESGLDIPNANTIIIDRADRFGLSDLYQLRGRVGRYKHQAYAYLLLPRHARLLTDVRKRISAIRQYATLGSGFKVAMRDLEIRGAGNLLGPEQSGHITAVGFDLYCQLLKESIAALSGHKVKPRAEVSVRLDFLQTNPGPCRADGGQAAARGARPVPHPACLPHAYIPEPQQRIEIYRKLAQAADRAALDALARELRDRFGPLPPAVDLLLTVAELKLVAAERGVSVVEVQGDRLMLTRHGALVMPGNRLPRLTRQQPAARLREILRLLRAM